MPVPFYHVFSGVPLYKPFSGFACKHVIGEIEKDFDLNEFSRGAKQGLLLVSEHLANQQFDKLETMVSPFAMDALRHSVERMTDDQRRQIAIGRDDFIKVLPYQVNQNFYQNNVPYLEITMVFLVIKGGHEKLRQFDVWVWMSLSGLFGLLTNLILILFIYRPLLLKFAENAKLCYCTFITELVDIYDSDSGDDSDDSSELSDAHVEFDWVINYFNQVKLIDPIDAVRHVLKWVTRKYSQKP